jgi:hypothetical protein
MTRNTPKKPAPLPDTAYWNRYGGRFSGILKWEDLDGFWGRLQSSPDAWYVFDPEQKIPLAAQTSQAFSETVATARALLETRREMSHSGAIYTDHMERPTFVKVFDPSNMGSACNISGQRTMPRWIFSHIPPDPLPPAAPARAKPGFLARFRPGRRG